MKILVLLLPIMLLIGIAAASTVTLTGTCYSSVINQTNNYITFNLTNSGNGTATNFLIVPEIDGASTPNATISLPLVAPGSTYSERIYLSNFTIPGSYVERFVTRYSQGSSTFVTLFPCLVRINKDAQSIIAITNLTRNKKGDNITVSISNIANYQMPIQISVYAPQGFNVTNPSRNVSLGQYATTNVSFGISTPQYTNSEFPIVVAASYISDNVHYATLAETTISFGAAAGAVGTSLTDNFLLFGIAAFIIIIVALIILSIVLKRRGHRRSVATHTGEGEHQHQTGEHHHAEKSSNNEQ